MTITWRRSTLGCWPWLSYYGEIEGGGSVQIRAPRAVAEALRVRFDPPPTPDYAALVAGAGASMGCEVEE